MSELMDMAEAIAECERRLDGGHWRPFRAVVKTTEVRHGRVIPIRWASEVGWMRPGWAVERSLAYQTPEDPHNMHHFLNPWMSSYGRTLGQFMGWGEE